MTLDQLLAFAIVVSMMALFVWGRLRYDVVAGLALLAAVVFGVVPFEAAFKGFGDDIVIIVGSALLVSAAVARSGIIEALLHPLAPKITFWKRSGEIKPEQEKVARIPLGLSNCRAIRLISL